MLTFSDEIRDHTNGRGVDVILNSLAGEALLKGVSILAPYGRFLEIGKRDLFGNSRLGLWPLRLNASFHAIDLGAVLQEKPSLAEPLFMEVRSAFQAGMLHPLPYTTWPASKVGDAFRTMSQGKHIGKLVIDMCDSELQITSSDVPRDSPFARMQRMSSVAEPAVSDWKPPGGLHGVVEGTSCCLSAEDPRNRKVSGRQLMNFYPLGPGRSHCPVTSPIDVRFTKSSTGVSWLRRRFVAYSTRQW